MTGDAYGLVVKGKVVDVIATIDRYAKRHKIRVKYEFPMCMSNEGASGKDIVWLGHFDDARTMALAFSHELGHIELGKRKRKVPLCIYEQELNAWCIGLRKAEEIFGIGVNEKDTIYIHKCLDSYRFNNTESNFYHG